MRLLLAAFLSLVPFAVGAADGDVTPAFLCEEFTGGTSPQCLKCAKAIIPDARAVVKSCEKKCNARYPGAALETERIVCGIDCHQAYQLIFDKFCR
jgi:hypothetical protein